MNTNDNDPMARPISPVERLKLARTCRELDINMAHYASDQALIQAITAAVLAEVAEEENPEAGFYQI
jgi:hypothetical protein